MSTAYLIVFLLVLQQNCEAVVEIVDKRGTASTSFEVLNDKLDDNVVFK
jgi:hypothetical protein